MTKSYWEHEETRIFLTSLKAFSKNLTWQFCDFLKVQPKSWQANEDSPALTLSWTLFRLIPNLIDRRPKWSSYLDAPWRGAESNSDFWLLGKEHLQGCTKTMGKSIKATFMAKKACLKKNNNWNHNCWRQGFYFHCYALISHVFKQPKIDPMAERVIDEFRISQVCEWVKCNFWIIVSSLVNLVEAFMIFRLLWLLKIMKDWTKRLLLSLQLTIVAKQPGTKSTATSWDMKKLPSSPLWQTRPVRP